MSKCLTIDEAIDQKDTCVDITAKDIVEFILEEALHSAVIISGCSRIGDFNITEDFCQQYDQPRHLKNIEAVNNPSTTSQELSLNSGEKTDHSVSLLTAKENLEFILDSFAKKEGLIKSVGECKIISEEVLADNELQIQNGQIHLESNKSDTFTGAVKNECFGKEDVIKDKKIEIEYYNEGKLNKIYVNLGDSPVKSPPQYPEQNRTPEENKEEPEQAAGKRDDERPFSPCTTEELREVYFEDTADPNRPRGCAIAEDEIKKITEEIEEINFNRNHSNSEDFDMAYHTDGQGDVDLESKSFSAKSKENLEKASKAQEFFNNPVMESVSFVVKSIDDLGEPFCGQKELEVLSSEKMNLEQEAELFPETSLQSSESLHKFGEYDEQPLTGNSQGGLWEYNEASEEFLLNSRLYNESVILREKSNNQIADSGVVISFPSEESETSTSSILSKGEAIEGHKSKDRKHQEESPSTTNLPESFLAESLPTSSQTAHEHPDDFTPDIGAESEIFERKGSMRSKSANTTAQEHSSEFCKPINPGASSLETLPVTNEIPDEQINIIPLSGDKGVNMSSMDSNSSFETEGREKEEVEQFPSQLNFTDSGANPFSAYHYGDDPYLLPENINEKLRVKSDTSRSFQSEEEIQKPGATETEEETQPPLESRSISSNFSGIQDEEINTSKDAENEGAREGSSTSSQSQLTLDNESTEGENATKSFKLHSQKMYSGVDFVPENRKGKKFTLSNSEEAFVESAESVLQVIDPSDEGVQEDTNNVYFSLLSETNVPSNIPEDTDPDQVLPSKKDSNLRKDDDAFTKRTYSGMTTIGPMKNTDYDPKDLTRPDIDFGKMTRITPSRQLGKDIFGAELTLSPSVKILDDDDSDESRSIATEGDRLEVSSLINRDIASLTKVQKVREVMSYHPKPDEYFEDDDTLTRPRLDLKDVESMTDERYKVPDVSIPLLSIEVRDSHSEVEKELIQNMNLVLSGNCFNSAAFYEDDLEEGNLETNRSPSAVGNDYVKLTDSSDPVLKTQNSKSLTKNTQKSLESTSADITGEENLPEDGIMIANDDSQNDASTNPKYGTLGTVFRKASNKFIRKDADLVLRNTKSLPRDTSKLTPRTDSIKSILDECQTSASNVLKKSRSLLKNTQGIIKSLSQSRFASQDSSSHSMNKEKCSPSETQLHTIERKFSSLLRKEELTRAKNLIKSKFEKTFKSSEESGTASQADISSAKKDLRIAVRNDEDFRVDRIENFQKLLPKSPLVYKSQFVKSQIIVPNDLPEPVEVASSVDGEENQQVLLTKGKGERISKEAGAEQPEAGAAKFEDKINDGKIPRTDERGDLRAKHEGQPEESELHQADYIVMETVQGLPTTDLENYSGGMETQKEHSNENKENRGGNEVRTVRVDASNSFQMTAANDGANDVSPCFLEKEEEKGAKTPSDRKIKNKQKKFTSRFRSFWCSAFGKVKPPPKKGDLS